MNRAAWINASLALVFALAEPTSGVAQVTAKSICQPSGDTGTVGADPTFLYSFASAAADWSESMIRLRNGGYLLGAWSDGLAPPHREFLLVRTDDSGAVVAAADGGFLVGGIVEGMANSVPDLVAVKLDRDGKLEWATTVVGDGTELLEAVVRTPDGGFALLGTTDSFGSGNRSDVVLVKLAADGTVVFDHRYGGSGDDFGMAILPIRDGGFVIAGSTVQNEQIKGRVFRTDPEGGVVWAREVETPIGVHGTSVVSDTQGGYTISGVILKSNDIDVVLVRTDHDGRISGCTVDIDLVASGANLRPDRVLIPEKRLKVTVRSLDLADALVGVR